MFLRMPVFRELVPPEAAAQRSPPKTCICVRFLTKKLVSHYCFKNAFFRELFPPEAAAQRSPPKTCVFVVFL